MEEEEGKGENIRVDSTKVESAQQEGTASSAPIWGICILSCKVWPITRAPKPRRERDGQLCSWEASPEIRNAEASTATQREAMEGGVLRRWKSYFQGCGRSSERFLGAKCSWAWYPVLPAASRSLEPPPQEGKGGPGLEGAWTLASLLFIFQVVIPGIPHPSFSWSCWRRRHSRSPDTLSPGARTSGSHAVKGHGLPSLTSPGKGANLNSP